MKKLYMLILMVVILALTGCGNSSSNEKTEEAEEETEGPEEITFRDLRWGMTYEEVEDHNSAEGGHMYLMSRNWGIENTYSVDDIALEYGFGKNFDYEEICLVAFPVSEIKDVAGYEPAETNLYFAYTPVYRVLPKNEANTSLYGAQYVFETSSPDDMYDDLTDKLISLYGDPDHTDSGEATNGNTYEYTFWYGGNDTELVLTKKITYNPAKYDEIHISYIWMKGDELLQEANDTIVASEERKKQNAETSTNGL